MNHTTTKLNNGVEVLAHAAGHAKTFCNRTQAQNAAEKVGGWVWQPRLGPVFFVRFHDLEAADCATCGSVFERVAHDESTCGRTQHCSLDCAEQGDALAAQLDQVHRGHGPTWN